MNEMFNIPLNGLAAGENRFSWHAGKEFFESFENAEIQDADLDVEVVVEKSGRYVGVDCDVEGSVSVECDRCLETLDMPIDTHISLSVKFGQAEESEDHQEGEREIIFVPETDAELDMSQVIYDYVCLSLPMQRVHAPGKCNPETMKYFGATDESEILDSEDIDSPFSALKDMFK